MSSFHQMGHHSQNLLLVDDLEMGGAIVSPVNHAEGEVATFMASARDRSLEFVFDPQLYFPSSDRGSLPEWDYFPADVDSADLASQAWWEGVVDGVVGCARRLGCDSVISPAVVPRNYTLDYFSNTVDIGRTTHRVASGLRTYQTLLVGMDALGDRDLAYQIASIATRTPCSAVYLVLVSDVEPRREHRDVEGLKGAMALIHAIEGAELPVLVGYAGTEMVLWKAAGATSCATGKFFNLRRFTKSRFEEPGGGGGQLPYWAEESLIGLLRESDLLRVSAEDMLSECSNRSPFKDEIISAIGSQLPWLGLSWRHYLWWFSDLEARLDADPAAVRALLQTAESNWIALEDSEILMEERRNDGTWLRAWRRALAEYL